MKTETCTTEAPKSHRRKMLDSLHAADFWHEQQIQKEFSPKTKGMHRRYQTAIWWAIENLEALEMLKIQAGAIHQQRLGVFAGL